MSTLQKETSEQLQQMFGALRSLLAEDNTPMAGESACSNSVSKRMS